MWAHNLYETHIWVLQLWNCPQDDPFHPFTHEWSQQTPTLLRIYLIQNVPIPHRPEPVPSGPISSSRPTGYSAELMGFKMGIKREIAACPSL